MKGGMENNNNISDEISGDGNMLHQLDEGNIAYLLKQIMEIINDRIVYVDKDGYIRMMSRSYAEFLGVDENAVIGRHVTEVVENTRLHMVVNTGKPEIADVQIINGNQVIATRIPVILNGRIIGAVGKVLFKNLDELNTLYNKIKKIEKELELYKDEFKRINRARYDFDSIIGENRAINELKAFAHKAAKTNSNVLILGESGTGKELFAHAIHNASKRSHGPFIKVNCAAIPDELLESELFGYEGGSFTGAKREGKIGKFKAAHGGTIFLDEIGDIPLHMQVKLLRVLQDKEMERIGSSYAERVDVRIIAATNKDLEAMVASGKFREDLFYRLNVLSMYIPPLRNRTEDIQKITRHLIHKVSKAQGVYVEGISEKALEMLKRYEWPGNIRELENVIERAVSVMDGDGLIRMEHLPLRITGASHQKEIKSLEDTLRDAERQAIIDSLIAAKGSKTRAAAILRISRSSLYEKMSKYDISGY